MQIGKETYLYLEKNQEIKLKKTQRRIKSFNKSSFFLTSLKSILLDMDILKYLGERPKMITKTLFNPRPPLHFLNNTCQY